MYFKFINKCHYSVWFHDDCFFSRMTQLFPLRCEGPVDFEYQLIYVQPHPSFTVHPMNGKPYN